ncbi:MAG: hypothetical protein JW788_03310 [Candidatus Omnitrophica bacterium]|nr:hypothetical protein [Candidatus Omnitrophota bacterium]
MQAVNLKQQINCLVRLQKIDSEIFILKDEKEAKPKEIEVLDAAFEEKKNGLAEAEKKYLDLQKQKKEKETDLLAKEESIKKLQSQLYTLKTNKDYQAMLTQIEGVKADVSMVEDTILGLIEETEKAKAGIEEEKKKLQEEEKALNARKKEVQDKVKEIDEHIAQLESRRNQVIPGLEDKIVNQYERILNNRDGLAIVAVKNNSCCGCNMFVPPQVINLIKMYERIITCEVCNRMLYIEEDMEIDDASAGNTSVEEAQS